MKNWIAYFVAEEITATKSFVVKCHYADCHGALYFTMPVWQSNTTIFFIIGYQKLIKNVTLSITICLMTLNGQCCYAECHCTDCHGALFFTMPVWQSKTPIFVILCYQKLIKHVTLSTTILSLMPSMLSVVTLMLLSWVSLCWVSWPPYLHQTSLTVQDLKKWKINIKLFICQNFKYHWFNSNYFLI